MHKRLPKKAQVAPKTAQESPKMDSFKTAHEAPRFTLLRHRRLYVLRFSMDYFGSRQRGSCKIFFNVLNYMAAKKPLIFE